MPSKFSYFPKGAFADRYDDSEEFHQTWYGKHLDSMDEPRLFDLTEPDLSVYRFLCLPTFESPSVIRIVSRPERVELSLKTTDGSGGYGPGRLTLDGILRLERSQYLAFERAVEDSFFWDSSTKGPPGGCDGTDCIVEGNRGGEYHVVDRWQPKESPFAKLCGSFGALLPWPLRNRFYFGD